jgi:hypothetical protein
VRRLAGGALPRAAPAGAALARWQGVSRVRVTQVMNLLRVVPPCRRSSTMYWQAAPLSLLRRALFPVVYP